MTQLETRKAVRTIIEESVYQMDLISSTKSIDNLFRTKYYGTPEAEKWLKYYNMVMGGAQHAKGQIDKLTTIHLLSIIDYAQPLLKQVR